MVREVLMKKCILVCQYTFLFANTHVLHSGASAAGAASTGLLVQSGGASATAVGCSVSGVSAADGGASVAGLVLLLVLALLLAVPVSELLNLVLFDIFLHCLSLRLFHFNWSPIIRFQEHSLYLDLLRFRLVFHVTQ